MLRSSLPIGGPATFTFATLAAVSGGIPPPSPVALFQLLAVRLSNTCDGLTRLFAPEQKEDHHCLAPDSVMNQDDD